MAATTTICALVVVTILVVGGCDTIGTQHHHTEVIQTHIVFRHGERTTYKFYPNDPNINNTFFPMGFGGLTNNGKRQEYQLGEFLRKEYDTLLGEHYIDGILEARSTDTLRTIMSAQLVLAGLFPPSKEQTWSKVLPWQPIPVFNKLRREEDVMHPEECDRKLRLIKTLPNQPDIRVKFIKPYQKLFNIVQQRSGLKIETPHDLNEFYFIIKTEEDMNLIIPEWVRDIYPEPIHSTAALTYAYFNSNEEVRRINAGYLMQKMINDSLARIGGIGGRRMYLYSGHESTLGFLMDAMGVLKPHVPNYASAFIVEVHRDDHNDYFVKVRYREQPTSNIARTLIIPGCKDLCPIDQFIHLQKGYLPSLSIDEACTMHS